MSAVLALHAQLVGWRAVDVLDAEILDAVALLLPIDERAVEVGVRGAQAGIIGRGALGVRRPANGSMFQASLPS